MPAIDIPCPQCGRILKVPDRSMLGKKGKCGKCMHRFIMQEPQKVEPSRPVRPKPEPPKVEPTKAAPPKVESTPGFDVQFEFEGGAEEPREDQTLMGIAVRFVPEAAAPGAETFAGQFESAVPMAVAPAVAAAPQPAMPAFPNFDEQEAESITEIRRLKRRHEAQQRRKKLIVGAVAVVLLAGGLGGYFSAGGTPPKKKKGVARAANAAAAEAEEQQPAVSEKKSKPVDPITLKLVPEGARIVIHMRPAELWQSGGAAEEFRACLGPLGSWLENMIKTRCMMEPSKIEEALFALIPISRDAFDVAVVVRSTGDLKKSELIDKIDGELIDKPRPHYVGPERVWLIADNRTFASAPKSMAQSLVESVDGNPVTSDGMLAVMSLTNRKRHFTLVADLEDVRLGMKNLAPENAQKLVEGVVDFFGDDVETIAWGLQLGDNQSATPFASEIIVRNRLSRAAPKLQGDLQKKLAAVPEEVLELVKMTHPKKLGEKKIVGRYPIMTKMVEQKTHFNTGHRRVEMNVELPERAGPNLALGTLLTWDQTTRPDFGTAPAAATTIAAAQPNLPDKIADRLKKKISVDFKRTFLYEAVAWVSEQTGVEIKLDGNGMKREGVTQNQYQTFTMDNVPATAVILEIMTDKVKRNVPLVLIVDEDKKTATITGIAEAQDKKLKIFPLEPAPK